jgi:hypothetical protein
MCDKCSRLAGLFARVTHKLVQSHLKNEQGVFDSQRTLYARLRFEPNACTLNNDLERDVLLTGLG